MRRSHPAAAALVLLTACTPAVEPAGSAHAARAAPPPVQSPCRLSYSVLAMAEADLGMAPGESRQMAAPVTRHGPGGTRPLPEGCSVAWAVEGGAGEIDAVGRLTIAPAATVGDSLFVVARAMSGMARARVRIVAPGLNPLAGTWQQVQTPNCVGSDGLIGELVLRRSGGMMLTARPLETYVDIAGSYTFDPATGVLRLLSDTRAIDGGLFLEARARVMDDGALELQLLPGGDRVGLFAVMPGDEECRALFRRAADSP